MMSINFPPITDATEFHYKHGSYFRWLEAGKIASFIVRDVTRATIDAHVELTITAMKTFSVDPFPLVLLDFRSSDFTLTPYARERFKEITQTQTDLAITSYIAVVFASTVAFSLMARLHSLSAFANGGAKFSSAWTNYDKAVAWLLSRETTENRQS